MQKIQSKVKRYKTKINDESADIRIIHGTRTTFHLRISDNADNGEDTQAKHS